MSKKRIVEVIRVLRYIGPAGELMEDLSRRQVKGTKKWKKADDEFIIEEAILGDYPQLRKTAEKI